MKIYPFHGLGVGGYESVSFRQGGVHHNLPFSKKTFLEMLQLLFLVFWKILHVLQFCLKCVKSWWFFKKTYLNSKIHLICMFWLQVFNVFTCVCPKLALNMHASHGVWLLWPVLVPRFFPFRFSQSTLWMISLGGCVGLCLLWWGAFLHVLPPWFWPGFLGNACCWCVWLFLLLCLGPFGRFPLETPPPKPHV